MRRSGAVGRRRGTWGGWSGDATAAHRYSDSDASSQCSPSRQSPAGWRSPLTVACERHSIEKLFMFCCCVLSNFLCTIQTVLWLKTHVHSTDQCDRNPTYSVACMKYLKSVNGDKWLNPDDWVCLTWTRRGYFQYELSDLHSAAAEPGPSPQGTRSFGPAQKQSTTTAQSFIHQTRWPNMCIWKSVHVCCFVHVVAKIMDRWLIWAYHFLQVRDLLLLVMYLLVLHFNNFLQALQVLLNVLVWS